MSSPVRCDAANDGMAALAQFAQWAESVFVGVAGVDSAPDCAALRHAALCRMRELLQAPPDGSGMSTVAPLGLFGDIEVELCALGPDSASARLVAVSQPTLWFSLEPDSPLLVRRYRAVDVAHREVFDPSARLEVVMEERVQFAAATPDAAELRAVQVSAEKRAPTLKATAPAMADFVWTFDTGTLQAQTLSPANVDAGRLSIVMDYYRASGDVEGAFVAEHLLTHPVYFVRWKAMQVLAERCPERADLLLRSASADAHPVVRTTAARLLAARQEG